MAVYVLHFARRYRHAGHYLGYSNNVERRVREHKSTHDGVPLMRAVNQAGIPWTLARVFPDGDRGLEKQLRLRKNTPRLCPQCIEQQLAAKGVPDDIGQSSNLWVR